MNIELDTHTHTLASGHAYNTIREMIEAAAAKGLKLLALTEHAPAMPGSCGDYYFYNEDNKSLAFSLLSTQTSSKFMLS